MHPKLFALYVGPDQVMPVMSVLATIMGIVMVFWTKLKIFFARLFGMGRTSAPPPPSPSVPPSAPQASVGAERPKHS
jgi:hypothetical protein